jgi:hypothetical protein
VSAFIGALVGFAGTYFIQRGIFRKSRLDQQRERLGILRGLRADLHVAKLLFDGALKSEAIGPGLRCPVELWQSSGHRILGAVTREAGEALNDAFGRLAAINGTWAALPDAIVKDIDPTADDKVVVPPQSLKNMIEKIDGATSILDRLEGEYERREEKLLHPVKSRLPW